MSIIYRKRNSLFRRGETEWRVEDDAFVRRTPNGTETRLKWTDVRSVRLRRNPSLASPWMHIFTVRTRKKRLTVNNAHFAGLANFEDRSDSYSPLVRAALERIAAEAPRATVYLGSSPLSFAVEVGSLGVAVVGLAIVLIVLPLPDETLDNMGVKLLIIAAMLPLLWLWLKENWPRKGDLRHAADKLPSRGEGFDAA